MNKLVATCLESKVHIFDMRTQHPVKGFAHLTEKVLVFDRFLECLMYPVRIENITTVAIIVIL